MTFTTRFAPSPTGPLHLGHAYSACVAFDAAQAHDGRFLLRIEDIDQTRARPEWEAQIYDDLSWLGLTWEAPVMRQSERLAHYDRALSTLWRMGVLYPCTCNRRDIRAAASAPQEGAPITGPDGIVYPGTCRTKPRQDARPSGQALRLDMRAALARLDGDLKYLETGDGVHTVDVSSEFLINGVGDVVLARRDFGTSYHLSVVVDDADQGVSHVVRGADLREATGIHVVLQRLLDLPTPAYLHHRLIRDDAGKRLAKRDDARAIAKFREDGASPQDIRAMVGLPQTTA